jgi:zinc and cadmium transporter
MLGIGLLHLLPHAIVESGSLDIAIGATLVGLLFMFFLIRTFHFHQHGTATPIPDESGPQDADHEHHHGHEATQIHGLSWTGVALGLSVHTLIDGIALGAAVLSDATHEASPGLYGMGVFLAILLHKPLDALSITTLMLAGKWPARARTLVNTGFALMCPLGAALFVLGLDQLGEAQPVLLGAALGFSAGVFLCISLSDLLPEVHFHSHDQLKLSAALLLGVALAFVVGFVEPEHAHSLEDHQHQTTGHE